MDFIRRLLGQTDGEEGSENQGKTATGAGGGGNNTVTPNSHSREDSTKPIAPALNPETSIPAGSDTKTDELLMREMPDDDTSQLRPSRIEPAAISNLDAPTEKTTEGTNNRFELTDLTRQDLTRKLPAETASLNNPRHLTFSLVSDLGMERQNNEDAAFAFFSASTTSEDRPDFGIFVVADGMGGHQDGEKASAIASRTLVTQILQEIYIPLLQGVDDSDRQKPINETLIAAANKANENVLKQVKDGGTTLTAVTIIGNLAHIVHVGDSRVYLIGRDGIDRLTRDHSLVQRLIELDHITQDEAVGHAQAGILYRAIGQNENLEVDTITRRLPAQSSLLVCSDGLWGEISESEIFNIVSTNDPQTACDVLVETANSRGGKDNISVIVIKLPK